VIIGEAAAIPPPLVRNLVGPYLVFTASIIDGYEGAGRSLSLKLIQQLRESTRPSHAKEPRADQAPASASVSKKPAHKAAPKSRFLVEIKLESPIRYSAGDKVEKWLNGILCLDAMIVSKGSVQGRSHPSQCGSITSRGIVSLAITLHRRFSFNR